MKKIALIGLGLICLFAFCKPHSKSDKKVEVKEVLKAPSVPLDTFYDDLAAYISGIPKTKSRFDSLQKLPSWISFSKYIDSVWKKMDEARLQKMDKWAGTELVDAKKLKTVFYPFAGPDFLHVFTFFPEADTFYLLGLELVGNYPDVPAMKTANLNYYFENMKISLADIFGKSYFITRKMGAQLQANKIDGVLPVLCLFLKRTGNDIVSIDKIDLNNQGTKETKYGLHAKTYYRPCGIKIRFVNKNYTNIKTVYYFSADLSDGQYKPVEPTNQAVTYLYKFFEKLPTNCVTYVKSASYLLHYPFFSNIRAQVLAKSKCVLQDDTGVPYKNFDLKLWDVQLYGVYVKPIEDFKGLGMQADMKKAYSDSTKVKPLPFNIGYHWRTKEDNLIYAKRK